MTDSDSRRSWKAPPAFWSLSALWGFAVAQPLYDLLGTQPEFFIEHRTTGLDLGLFVVVLSLFMPLALVAAVEVFRRLNDRLGSWLQLSSLTVLSIALGAQIAVRLPALPGLMAAVVAVLVGFGFVGVCYRWTAVHTLLSWIAAASFLLFPALFLSAPAVHGLWLPAPPVESLRGGTGAPIVILVLDEMPLASLLDKDDRIDPERFPSFAALARTSLWFPNATAVANSTGLSVTALLTSSRPKSSAAPVTAEYPQNLFTALGETYEMHVVERVTQLCPTELCPPIVAQPDFSPALGRDLAFVYLHLVTPEAWRSRLPAIDQTWGAFGPEATSREEESWQPAPGSALDPKLEPPYLFRHFVAGMKPGSRPTLHYLHLLLPHVPWKYLPSGQEYPQPGNLPRDPGKAKGTRRELEWGLIQAHQRHLLQVEFTDRLLGEFISALEQNGIFDDSLFILTADHGVSFVPDVGRRSGPEVLNVPLMVKLPGQMEGQIVERHVTLLDVLPTILKVVRLEEIWRLEGQPLSPEPPGGPGDEAKAEASQVSRARRKTVRRKLDLFPGFLDPGGLYRIGPHSELLGGRPDRWLAATDSPLPSVELDRPWFLEDVDPTGPFVPSAISGRLVAPPEGGPPWPLAVAVNGRIAGVTYTLGGREATFSAMVEPTVFTRGSNQVEVFQIVDRPTPGLVRLPEAGNGSYRLASTDEELFLSLPDGDRVRVSPEAGKDFSLALGFRVFVVSGRLSQGPNGEVPLVLLFDRTRLLGPIPVAPDQPPRIKPPRMKLELLLPFSLVHDPGTLRVIILRGTSAQIQELRLVS